MPLRNKILNKGATRFGLQDWSLMEYFTTGDDYNKKQNTKSSCLVWRTILSYGFSVHTLEWYKVEMPASSKISYTMSMELLFCAFVTLEISLDTYNVKYNNLATAFVCFIKQFYNWL